MGDHARLSPSNHRWPHCPGSVRVEAAYPDIPGAAAIDGTGSHLLLELCLTNNVRAEQYVGQLIGVNHPENLGGWLVHEDRATRVQMCLDYISTRVREIKERYRCTVTVHAESRANPGSLFGRDDWQGTCDVTITGFNDTGLVFLETVDYKDGRGWVGAEDNTQLISYLGGKLAPYLRPAENGALVSASGNGVGYVRMTIVQPKTMPVVRYQNLHAYEFLPKLQWLAGRAAATDDPEAPLIPDDKGGKGYCTWCKHKPNCEARVNQGLEKIRVMDITPTASGNLLDQISAMVAQIKDLPDEKLADLMDAEAGITALFAQARTEVQARVDAGRTVPGFAMLPGNGKNVWAYDEETVVKKLKAKKLSSEDIYPPKLASPAQILKNPKLTPTQIKNIREDLVTHIAGELKLTRVDRPAKPTAEMMFADVAQQQAPAQIPVDFGAPEPAAPAAAEPVSFF